MTLDIAMVLLVLAGCLVLFVTEWLRMDLVALLALSALATLGLVSPEDAISGFSNPAVITVWAMFIMSEGLTRAGIADQIGRQITRLSGRSESRMVAIFMLAGGALSAFMNNIGVAALLMPVAVEVARRGGVAPSRVLMPLAYGTLLGGVVTLIGTPPNLLVSNVMIEAGYGGFGFLDFAWIGLPVLLAGTLFVALFGRRLLPVTNTAGSEASQRELRALYGLDERVVALRIPSGSLLVGRSLAQSGLGSAAGLLIIALTRHGQSTALPGGGTLLNADDILLAQGRLDRFDLLRQWGELVIERESPVLQDKLWENTHFLELRLADDSPLAGQTLRHRALRQQYGVRLLAVRNDALVKRTRLAEHQLAAGDRLLVQAADAGSEIQAAGKDFSAVRDVSEEELRTTWKLNERLFVLHVPEGAALAGRTIDESGLEDLFDFRLQGIFRDKAIIPETRSEEILRAGDLMLVQGRQEDMDVLRGLQALEQLADATPYLRVFDEGQLEVIEATLHPHARVEGRLIRDLSLEERYQVSVIAVWRNGRPYRSGMHGMALQHGDGLLIVGPRQRLAALGNEHDLLLLNPVQVTQFDARKAPLAGGLMALTVLTVLVGWLPIHIAAIAGAALMVLTRCLNMEQAHRAIEWRSIFLIAGMLPLGVAMQSSGAAELLASGVIAVLGPFGPWPVLAGIYALTALGTLVVPTAALVLLMAPIALSAAADLAISPIPAVMVVAIAASASFASPVAHPANVLVMGPGGYRFADYLKLGGPLTLVVFAVAILLMPMVWPLR